MGELGAWYVAHKGLDVDYRVIEMHGYHPNDGPGFGWPEQDRAWVNPSPNAASLNMGAGWNAPIVAAGPGKVIYAGRKSGYGRVVDVDHAGIGEA